MHTIQTGSSVYTTPGQTTHTEAGKQTSDSKHLEKDNGPSTVAVTLPTVFFGLLILICVIAVVVFLVHRAYKRRHSYEHIHPSRQSQCTCLSVHPANERFACSVP